VQNKVGFKKYLKNKNYRANEKFRSIQSIGVEKMDLDWGKN
jgi:hypothetical protein